MPDIFERFGNYISKVTPEHPDRSRALLLAAYRAYGLKLRLAPDRALPKAHQFSAQCVNQAVQTMLAHPERAALVSIFQPCELLEAMSVTPMCAELYSCFLNGAHAEPVFAETAEAEGIAESFCSYHKILLGSAYAGVLPAPKFIVNTSLVCDANNLTFRELADHYGIPRFYVDVPPEQSEEGVAFVADQLQELKKFLEDQTGKRLDEDRLKSVVARSKQTMDLLRACQVEKRSKTLTSDVTSELYEVYLTHSGMGSAAALRYAQQLLKDLKAAPAAHGIRLLWLHTIPNWQEPVRQMLNFNDRCQIVTCDTNFEGLVDMDPERPYESMARRLVYSQWNGGETRVKAAVEAARALNVDGVICFCHWGCKQTMGLSGVFKRELDQAGFPTLILNGDGCDRRNASDGQTATRLNAFLEMLEKRNG